MVRWYKLYSEILSLAANLIEKYQKHYRFLMGLLLGISVFLLLGTAVGPIWFREDDLGTILNGLVTSWEGFIKVFSTDVRDFICPINYHRSAPNLISGFLRPLQHFLFTVEHYFFQHAAYPYFLVHVGLHAVNTVLVYCISLWFLPVGFAFFTGLFFSLYPDVSWLTWIATAQNTLCTLFLLVSIIFFKKGYTFLAGSMFFVALLARENIVFMPIWFFIVALLCMTHQQNTWTQRVVKAMYISSVFFVFDLVYWYLRWWAFGFGTITRTLNNMLLRFPFLTKFVVPQSMTLSPLHTQSVMVQETSVVKGQSFLESFFNSFVAIFNRSFKLFIGWLSSLTMLDLSSVAQQVLVSILFFGMIIFLYYAYTKKQSVFLIMLSGIILMSWPAVVAYPCPRYLNTVYPFVALLVTYGAFLGIRNQKMLGALSKAIIFIMAIALVKGVFNNRSLLYSGAATRADYKKRFDNFFASYTFSPGTRFVVVCSPFVSDIQSIFQSYLNDFTIQVAHEPFTTFAEQGVFGCSDSYKTINVMSYLKPIHNGFRFISQDPEHCAWWIHFSDHPLAWSEEDRAYKWTSTPYQENMWYACSLGTFKINQMLAHKYLVDVSFVFDKKWIDANTVVVVWDTMQGRYKTLAIN